MGNAIGASGKWLGNILNDPVLHFLAEFAICSTILVTGTICLVKLNSKWSAAIRYRVFCSLFCGVASIPVALIFVPGMEVPVLPPQVDRDPISIQSTTTGIELAKQRSQTPDESQYPNRTSVDSTSNLDRETQSNAAGSFGIRADETIDLAPRESFVGITLANNNRLLNRFASPASQLALLIWAIGFLITILPMILRYLFHSIFKRNNYKDFKDNSWTNLVGSQKKLLQIEQSVRIQIAATDCVPMTFGILRPTILFPSSCVDWTNEYRRMVVLHELGHIKRQDIACQSIFRLVCSLFWFQPLLWLLLRKLETEREFACDDLVLSNGVRPSIYANLLLELATGQIHSRSLCVGIATKSNIEKRIKAILTPHRDLRALGFFTSNTIVVVAVLATLSSTMLRIGNRTSINRSIADSQQLSAHLTGTVRDHDGNPAPDCEVSVYRIGISRNHPFIATSLESTYSGNDGQFKFKSLNSNVSSNDSGFEYYHRLVARKPGHPVAWSTLPAAESKRQRPQLTIPKHDQIVRGVVVDQLGKRLPNATIKAIAIHETDANVNDWIGFLSRSNGPNLHFPSHRVLLAAETQDFAIATQTDSKGVFHFPNLGNDRLIYFEVKAPGMASRLIRVLNRNKDSLSLQFENPISEHSFYGNELKIEMTPESRVAGYVIDSQGTPLANAVVTVRTLPLARHALHIQNKTNDQGRFELAGLPYFNGNKRLNIVVHPNDKNEFLPAEFSLAPGEPVGNLELTVQRGTIIRGQVINSKTGNPTLATITYRRSQQWNRMGLNSDATTESDIFVRSLATIASTDDRGFYSIAVAPRKGVLEVAANAAGKYRRVVRIEELVGQRHRNSSCNGILHVDQITDHSAANISLSPLEPTQIQVSAPIANAQSTLRAYGQFPDDQANHRFVTKNLSPNDKSINVYGLNDSNPRHIAILDGENGLGFAGIVNENTRRIELNPCVTAHGKLDLPCQILSVYSSVSATLFGHDIPGNPEPIGADKFVILDDADVAEDGTFQLNNIIPGSSCFVQITVPGHIPRVVELEIPHAQIEPIDLGTIEIQTLQSSLANAEMN